MKKTAILVSLLALNTARAANDYGWYNGGQLRIGDGTPSTALMLDANNNVVSSSVTSTELGYVHGVTSDIQTQLNAKEPTLSKGNLSESTSSVLTITGGNNAVIGSGTSIEVKQSSSSQDGYLSSADWSTFNGKQNALSFGNVTESTSSVLTLVGGTGAVIGSGLSIEVKQSSASQDGYLSSADWSTFNGKQNALSFGNLSESTSSVLTITGGTGAVIGSGASIEVKQASASQDGYLSSTDWSTFNAKQPAGSYALSGANSDITSMSGLTGAISGPDNLVMAHNAGPSTPAAGYDAIYVKSDHKLYMKDEAGNETLVAAQGDELINANIHLSNLDTVAINEDLLFGADGAKDIGASGASRPNNVYVKNSMSLGSSYKSEAPAQHTASGSSKEELANLAVPTNSVLYVSAKCVARNSSDAAAFEKKAVFSRGAGNASRIGNVNSAFEEKSAGASAWVMTIEVGGDNASASVALTSASGVKADCHVESEKGM